MNEIAEQIAAQVRVELGKRSYNIEIGPNLLSRAGELILEHLERRKCAIVTDENVAAQHLATLENSLADASLVVETQIMPAGEATKSFTHLANACERLLEMGVERGDLVIAFGGGVIGDFAGFAASILRRGVRFVQIPTTLLSQVDSSVGGKTGINTPQGKNLIGTFHQPSLVIADTRVLETLPPRELAAGYAEIVKYGVIDDAEFFVWLEENGERLLEGDEQARIHAIATSCRAKARIVAEDEYESGRRALLNLGHTFGHALESWAGYTGDLLHGEGVAIGMVMALELSEMLGNCRPGAAERLERHLRKVGLPTRISDIAAKGSPAPETLIDMMAQDKKVEHGNLVFIMAHGIGTGYIDHDVPMSALREYLVSQC